MIRWAWPICRRLGGWIAFILALHAALFVLFDLLPDAAARHLGWAALSPELLRQTRVRMGLSASSWQRYWEHLRGLTHGHLGHSMLTGVPVTELLSNALRQSAALWCIGAVAIAAAPIVALLVIIRPKESVTEAHLRMFSRLGLAPQLLIAAVAFAGYSSVAGNLSASQAHIARFILGSLSTAAYPGALAYLIATDIAAGLRQAQFVRMYRAIGLSWLRIRILLLKNVVIAFAPYSPRLAIGMLLSSGLTEFVFSINGFGLLFFRALRSSDLGVMYGCVLAIGVVVGMLSELERKVRGI